VLAINSVFDNVVVAKNLVKIVEADLNVPISEKLVRAKEAGCIDDYVIESRSETSVVCRMTVSRLLVNRIALDAILP
jgi:hypothetical protein